MPLQPGQSLGHYRIERLIGQGGMGQVFVALDTKLNRRVALKVLPEAMAADPDRLARFEREARAVAALNHPHIVTLFSVEEERGTHFLTMELVEGDSLDHALPAGGLPLTKVFDVGIALADALSAAHDKGIIHRDIKPANVIVTRDGRVKVLDFGLAKLALGSAAGDSPERSAEVSSTRTHLVPRDPSLTNAGGVVGTVPYMSPEQVGGDSVDARTDIFALGVMLYEMATGRRPFQGKNNAETISSILRDAPRPVSEARQDAPRHLARIIDHCLQKDPEARFQTAKDVRNELRVLRMEVESGHSHAGGPLTSASTSTVASQGAQPRRAGKGLWMGLVGALAAIIAVVLILSRGREGPAVDAPAPASGTAASAAAGAEPKSIAVLPFVDMSQNKDKEYFSDGISEELLNLLAKIPELRVAARTSSFSFKGKNVEIQEVARQLNVAHVLEGSVRKAGDRVRITAQLIHAVDGYHVWSQTWDRTLDDIFAIQDEIAADVVKQLKVTLLGEVPKTRATDPEAYALYLQSRQIALSLTQESFEKSDALLHRVLEIDPRYAPAWIGLAANYFNKAGSFMPEAEGMARARETARKALEIDPEYAPAHATLGFIAMYGENDPDGAARHLERAMALAPTEPRVLNGSAVLLHLLGRPEEALALHEANVKRDPLNATFFFNKAIVELALGRSDDVIATLRTAVSLAPGHGVAHALIAVALLKKGDHSAALAEAEQETNEQMRATTLPIVYHALGRMKDSDAALDTLIAQYAQDNATGVAGVYAFRGEADQAFAWLDKAAKAGESSLAEIPSIPFFEGIRKDPRWLPFLRGIGKAPEQLARIQFKVPPPQE